MTDCERFLAALREAGPQGLHSHDARRQGLSGNPSQRAADLEAKGYAIRRQRENRGKRPGVRFFLVGSVGIGAGNRNRLGVASEESVLPGATGVQNDGDASVDPGGGSPQEVSSHVPPGDSAPTLFELAEAA